MLSYLKNVKLIAWLIGVIAAVGALALKFMTDNKRLKTRSKLIREDTRAQQKLDERMKRRKDEKEVADFARKFGPKS
jgi:hypothetical protein